MEGATLTIALRDESNQGQGSPATTPQGSGGQQAPSHVSEQQQAITQAGGVGQQAESRYRTAPTTTSSTSASETVATAAAVPIAAATPTPVVTTTQAPESALEAPTRPPAPSSSPTEVTATPVATPTPTSTVEPESLQEMIARARKGIDSLSETIDVRKEDLDAGVENYYDTLKLINRERRNKAEAQAEDKAAEKNFDDDLQSLINKERRSKARAQNEDKEQSRSQDAAGANAQFVVNAISHFAHAGGPLGSAVAGAMNTAAAMPGVSSMLGNTVPALSALGPPVIAAAAGISGVGAAMALANNEANRAIAISRQYSAEAIGAEAEASVRQIQADVRTSKRLGDESAAIIDATSRRNVALQGIRDMISEPILQDWAKFNNAVANAAEMINNLTGTGAASQGAGRGIADIIGNALFGNNYWLYRGIGGAFGQSERQSAATQGIMGIIPDKLGLPYPFTNPAAPSSPSPPVRGTAPGLGGGGASGSW